MIGMSDLLDDLLAAADAATFARRCGIASLYVWQVEALRSSDPREVWAVARQCGKSTGAAILAVHKAVYTPGSTVVIVSPGMRQSSETFMKARAFYSHIGKPAGASSDSKTELRTESGSRIIATPGTEATIRGLTADLLLLDEAARMEDATWTGVRPYVATTGGRVVLLSTPWTRAGFFADAALGRVGGWTVRTVRADAVHTAEFLARERAGMLASDYAREYEVSFDATTSALWSEKDWRALIHRDVEVIAPVDGHLQGHGLDAHDHDAGHVSPYVVKLDLEPVLHEVDADLATPPPAHQDPVGDLEPAPRARADANVIRPPQPRRPVQGRVAHHVQNVVENHQEAIEVSYTHAELKKSSLQIRSNDVPGPRVRQVDRALRTPEHEVNDE